MWKWEADGQAKAVVVIVHSAYENHHRHAWLIQQFRISGFDVITGDLPGHGPDDKGSPHGESFDDYMEFTGKMIEAALKETVPVFVVGHGLGAVMVIRTLQRRQLECAGVILSSPWLVLKHQPPKFSSMLTRIAGSMKLDHGITYDMLSRNEEERPKTRHAPEVRSIVTGSWYKEMAAFTKGAVQSEKPVQDVPMLIHTAGADRLTDIRETKKWLKRQPLTEFQFKEWRGFYHDVYLEPEREEVFQYTKSFIDNGLRSLGYVIEN
ncbi:alpha/beta hydrolase [Sporosarcina trichiuri]|uniref:alpha/beta hydrolase n=1 Tax=Sporosarcina trichiuri TaxID=3056445 RepID=UPI0025B49972|nr:alpha/beta hydrolase [Sporosarcina sp. 0.2-SM1T-5]WJY27831.1 alpha/beta hydrolase [Sporosarcina sp. 0.2-SM1T-5]